MRDRIDRSFWGIAKYRTGEFYLFARHRFVNSHRGKLAHLRSVHGFFAAVRTVAAGEYLRIRRLHLIIDDNAAFVVHIDTGNVAKKRAHFLLPDGLDHHVAFDLEKLERTVGLLASKTYNM